ncbi:MAG: hypothetical protein J6B06_07205 [Lachnospiraceae bacterium]|nr:hypothetical protein [Lachnospiraceae bacterium]
MNAEILRSFLPDFKEKLVLNAFYRDGECYSVLAMLAKREDKLCLWEIRGMSEEETERHTRRYRRPATNRQAQKEGLRGGNDLRIRELELDGQHLSVSSATGTCLGEGCNEQERVLFLCLLQNGVRLGELEQTPFERLTINCYEMQEQEFPQVNTEADGFDIVLKLEAQHIPVAVNKKLHLQTGTYAKPRMVRVKKEEEVRLYIHGVSFYDVWEDAKTRFEDKRYTERFSAEEIKNIKQQYIDSLPDICPQGSVIPIIEYESDKDYQMQFYSQDYLRRVPENKSSTAFLMMRPDEKTGPMGYKNYACVLEAVEKGFEGELAVELFTYYRWIPGKSVHCEKIC